tara:strand:- start:13286 stop:13639 length:354 start_codon:yes stop_codon:yes gene_type:complete
MSSKSKQKGDRFEREINEMFKRHGFDSKKVPLSGATWLKGDLITKIHGKTKTIECKVRAKGFKQIYEYLEGNDFVVAKSDRSVPLIITRLNTDFFNLIKGAENGCNEQLSSTEEESN